MSKTNPKDYVVDHGTSSITDVDLEKEDVRLPNGSRLTNEKADQIVERVTRKQGRPSLSGAPEHSPQIAVRVTSEVRDSLRARAQREGKSLSQLAREALESFA